MSDFLKSMAASSAARAAAVQKKFSAAELDRPALPLRCDVFDVIAELKDRSPAAGALTETQTDRVTQAKRYVTGGAAAISVLTEPSRFGGDLAHLATVVDAVAGSGVPVMRKDFLIDPVQILEAKAAGASGALLIVAMLSDAVLENLLSCAYEYSLFVLLESFDEEDLKRSETLLKNTRHLSHAEDGSLLMGINTRNLRSLEVDADRLARLAPLLPAAALKVAESGIGTASDAQNAAHLGYDMALVGTALMQSEDPAALLGDMLDAGRRRPAG